jgi:hypothetical protein
MANWMEIEDKLADILSEKYYREAHDIRSTRQCARECVQRAQGSALPAYSGEIAVVELKHPARPGLPTRLVRGFDTTRSHSPFGEWWIDYELFDRFRRATSAMPPATREQKIKAFMRARSAVSHDWSNMAGISELKLPAGSRTPALVGKAHYQAFVTNPKDPDYLPNVFLMGGDLQFYVCIRERSWIWDFAGAAGAA